MALFHISSKDGHAYVRGFQHDVHFTYQVSLGGLQVLADAGVRDGDEIPPDVYSVLESRNLLYTKADADYRIEPRTKIDREQYDQMVERITARRKEEVFRREQDERASWSRWIRAMAANVVREDPEHSTMWLVLARYAEMPAEEALCLDEFVRLQPSSRLADEALRRVHAVPRRVPGAIVDGPWRLGAFPECVSLAPTRPDAE